MHILGVSDLRFSVDKIVTIVFPLFSFIETQRATMKSRDTKSVVTLQVASSQREDRGIETHDRAS